MHILKSTKYKEFEIEVIQSRDSESVVCIWVYFSCILERVVHSQRLQACLNIHGGVSSSCFIVFHLNFAVRKTKYVLTWFLVSNWCFFGNVLFLRCVEQIFSTGTTRLTTSSQLRPTLLPESWVFSFVCCGSIFFFKLWVIFVFFLWKNKIRLGFVNYIYDFFGRLISFEGVYELLYI